MFGWLNVLHNSWLYLFCHTPISCFAPKVQLSTFLWNRLNLCSCILDNVQVLEAYVSTGLWVLYILIFLCFLKSNGTSNTFSIRAQHNPHTEYVFLLLTVEKMCEMTKLMFRHDIIVILVTHIPDTHHLCHSLILVLRRIETMLCKASSESMRTMWNKQHWIYPYDGPLPLIICQLCLDTLIAVIQQDLSHSFVGISTSCCVLLFDHFCIFKLFTFQVFLIWGKRKKSHWSTSGEYGG
jgi:hypothetical protein